ncbi:MAG: serine/threonine-protein phosphatase [Spirochaetia bacterium]|nr:serine/threonine-protein phosphatase [Spirochaetia bacterium]
MQAGEKKEQPAEFIDYLNDMLYSDSNLNLVTMFYGIFNSKTNELYSACAGHVPPILIFESKIEKLKLKKNFPCGIYSKQQLHKMGRPFTLSQNTIPAGAKILFYTDGLTECHDPNQLVFFEETEMQKTLEANSRQNCHMIVHHLYESVKKFKGDDNFPDDIFIICLETIQ